MLFHQKEICYALGLCLWHMILHRGDQVIKYSYRQYNVLPNNQLVTLEMHGRLQS